MVDGVTPVTLKPEFISSCDGLHEARQCHPADMPEDNKPRLFFLIAG
jgi:hypothetical protein